MKPQATGSMKKLVTLVLAPTVGALLLQSPANALVMTVDQILADQPAGLAGTVSMTLSTSGLLTITLANTSGPGSATGANGLLTGLAFNLPGNGGGVNILGGSVALAGGSTFVNSPAGDLSTEWGFQNASSPGHFNGLAVDTVVAAMQADTTTKFASGFITPPTVLNGPDYGLVRTGGDPGGLAAVQNSVSIALNLNKTFADTAATDTYLGKINQGLVAIEFGSPGSSVADGGSTLILLGLGVSALGWLSRRTTSAGKA